MTESSGSRVDSSGEYAYTLFGHDVDSNLVGICDDNGHHTHFDYDALDRLIKETDDLGSERVLAYDAASNVIRVTENERRADTSALDGVFYTESFYDELNRPIVTVSHLGNTRRVMYDSRGNVVATSDAMGLVGSSDLADLPSALEHGTFPQLVGATSPSPVGTINGRGNTSRFLYDGIGRLLRTERDLRQDGTGASMVVGQIVTETVWDGNGRVLSRIDPNGNATLYAHDHQNRLIREVYADGTDKRFSWNPVGTLAAEVDARGTAKSYAYDALERRSDMTVTGLPQGIGQTTFAAWDYDGLGRRTRAEDDDSIVETWFDSMSRRVAETQAVDTGAPRTTKNQTLSASLTGTVLRAYDGVGNLLKQTYPSTQTFERRYDEVDRLKSLKAGFGGGASEITQFVHAGMGTRRLERTYTPGSASLIQKLEYDGERRVVSLESYHSETTARIRGFGYAWDRENNRRWERRLSGSLHDELTGPGEAYRYDSAYRLVHDDRDVADSALDAITSNATLAPAVPFVAANASDYVLDAAGNRHQTTFGGVTQSYTLASVPTQDRAMNQYTTIGSAVRSHDRVGNLTGSTDTGRQAFYNADNRLVQWTEGSKDVRYRYDADGRRLLKEDASGSPSFPATVTFWDGWQEIEEYVPNGAGGWALNKRYVFGEGIDEVVRATLPDVADVDGDANTSEPLDLYYHHNSLGSVAAVTDGTGAVVESYRYSAYGTPTIYDKNGTEVATTQVEQPFMFTGRRWDFEEGSNLYYYRLRYYDPVSGRFVSRDPLGLWGDPGQRGNGQSYCGNNPVNRRDPFGLAGEGVMAGAAGGASEITIEGVLTKIAERGLASLTAEELAVYEAAQAAQAAEATAVQAGRTGAGAAGGAIIAGVAAVGAIIAAGSDIAESVTNEMMLREEEAAALEAQAAGSRNRLTDAAMREIERRTGRKATPDQIKVFHDTFETDGFQAALNAAERAAAGGVAPPSPQPTGSAPPDARSWQDRVRDAQGGLRDDGAFRDWFHRDFKRGQGMAGGGRHNRDLPDDLVVEAWEEWCDKNTPGQAGE